MGQLTKENELRINQLEIIREINFKLIKIVEKQHVDFILSGRHDMKEILRDKIDILKKENEEHQDNINFIYKYNKIR
ncbi:hypothetical protein [uncultured Clostridium sp.]|uniref:hypothetical protein n=1 Tax=uncultured Clostridium sp. TaxID=59620 RepID=UPI002616907F|nr:hypothetical protein [uncultured Clostridium sp.]